jgi:predicted transcriptional regulator
MTGHTPVVKTAVSLPDPLYHRAEAVARRLGLSRSGLYARALEDYLAGVEDREDEVTAALDRVHADSRLEPGVDGAAAGRALVERGAWPW